MTKPTPVPEPVERRTADHVPVDERHGRARDLFTVWMRSTMSTSELTAASLPRDTTTA